MSQITQLATGQITNHDEITVMLVEPTDGTHGTRQGPMAHSREVLSTRRRGRGLPRRNSPGLNVREVSTGLHLPAG
jgi:hypothetical protein